MVDKLFAFLLWLALYGGGLTCLGVTAGALWGAPTSKLVWVAVPSFIAFVVLEWGRFFGVCQDPFDVFREYHDDADERRD